MDVDPEEVIEFDGVFPRSNATDPLLKQRGLVTIAFFGLDDVFARKNLMKERAQVILALHAMLVEAERGDAEARVVVDTMLAPTAPHANCARSFDRLFLSDRPRADEIHHTVVKFLASLSP